jgi:demethylmenaquinone methyltransferase/2-methoxy-6-polyprenyl-1,4-benzoquinol methylase
MEYYWDTIENCVPYQVIVEAMRDSGFAAVRCDSTFGLFRSYIGRKS